MPPRVLMYFTATSYSGRSCNGSSLELPVARETSFRHLIQIPSVEQISVSPAGRARLAVDPHEPGPPLQLAHGATSFTSRVPNRSGFRGPDALALLSIRTIVGPLARWLSLLILPAGSESPSPD